VDASGATHRSAGLRCSHIKSRSPRCATRPTSTATARRALIALPL